MGRWHSVIISPEEESAEAEINVEASPMLRREDPRARWGANERIGATGKAQDTPQKKSDAYACQTKELPGCDSDRFLQNRQVNHIRGH